MIVKRYGTNQLDKQNNFTLTCDKCGSNNTSIIPASHYDNGQYSRPTRITLTLKCLSCNENHICNIA